MKKNKIIVVDFGGVKSQTIARKIRNLSVYCEIYPYKKAKDHIDDDTLGLVLTGETKEKHQDFIKEYQNLSYPILNIMDLDDASIENQLKNYIEKNSFPKNWTVEEYKEEVIQNIRDQVKDGKVLLALSGGVDSSVCAKLISQAIGNQLTCIFVDHGLMRKNEGKEVEEAFKDSGMNLITVDAEERFLDKLKGVTDPEQKRKIIGEEFIRIFEEEGRKIKNVDFLAQGTIYSDVIESGDDENETIKSHHNVGGLPSVIDFKDIIEPLYFLFKDEVRELGLAAGLDERLVWRQPFPGPGLAVRCLGEITKEKLDILRDADHIFREEIAKAGLDREYNQYFAILTNTQSTGNKNGKRTYDYTLALRAVITKDFMNAIVAEIPYDVLLRASRRITNEVEKVNRVVYDISSKPPATIEWE